MHADQFQPVQTRVAATNAHLAALIDLYFAGIGERVHRADGLGRVTGHAICTDNRWAGSGS